MTPGAGSPPVRSGGVGVAAWGLLCVASWFASGLVAYGIGLAVGSALPAGGADADFAPHRWTMTTLVATWGLLAPASVIAVTSVMFGLPRRALRRALPWAVLAAAIAAALEFLLLGWGFARYGVQGADPDLLGPAAFLGMGLVAVGTSVVALVVAPRAMTPRAYGPAVLLTLVVTAVATGMLAIGVALVVREADPDRPMLLAFLVGIGFLFAVMQLSVKSLGDRLPESPPAP